MIKNKIIICYTGNNWDTPWGMSQKVMKNLSKSNRVLYIEYQPSYLHRYFQNFTYTGYTEKKRGITRKIEENLYVYTPDQGLPFNNYLRTINILNQKRIERSIRSEIESYNREDIIFWIFAPYAIDFIKEFPGPFTIYHCAGNFSAEKENFLRKNTVLKMESDLTKRSDLIVAQTKSLTRRFGSSGKKTFYLPSAANFDRYSEKQDTDIDISEFHNIKSPRVGIIGYFNDIFYDTGLLEYLMDEKRDWSFVFIGPLSKNAKRFKKLTQKKNAFFLGRKSPNSIPAYISKVDIGIIPYKINNYMREVSPNKFYEYIACGKPVVSTELPDIKSHTDVLKIADSKYKFLEGMEHFLLEKPKEATRKRALIIAQENSFDKYLDRLSEAIERLMNEKRFKNAKAEA